MNQRRAVAAVAAATFLALLTVLGTGTAGATPRLGFSPPRLIFNPAGEARVVTLRNLGNTPLQLLAVAFSADSAGFATEPLGPQVLGPGQTLPVTVTYTRSGARPQAFGALLVYSDDPGGFDDPRSAERDWVRGVALVAGETPATLWLWLPPLGAAGLLLALRRRGRGLAAASLQWAGVLPPLLASLWLLFHFDPGFAVPDGNYGIQLGLHRALWPQLGVELWSGLDGLSLPLVLLLATAMALRPLFSRAAGEVTTAAGVAGALLLGAGALLVLSTLDAGFWLVGWELALLGAFGQLGGWAQGAGRLRPRGLGRWFLGSQLGVVLLGAALAVVHAHSLPTALVDGTTVAHSTDLIKLGYYNYFGDVALHGVALDRVLWGALTLGALLPVLLLPGVAAPLGLRLGLSLPLLVLAVYGTVRLSFNLLPQAGVALGPWLVGAALAWGLGGTLRALRCKTLPQLLGAAVAARAGTAFLGLVGSTQAGVQAALLQLWHHGLAVVWLALLLPQVASIGRRPRYQAGLVGAALLILDAPGMLGFVQRTLLVLGVFPGFRAAAAVAVGLSAILPIAVLRRAARPALPVRPQPDPSPDLGPTQVALAAGLAAVAILLGVFTQPLLDLSRGFVNDFITHVFSHLDASTLARL